MSLQVNLSGRDLLDAYQGVLNRHDIDWAVFTYERGTNDLKVQSTGSGGLEELEEEFSDGKCVLTYCAQLMGQINSYQMLAAEFSMRLLVYKTQMLVYSLYSLLGL